MNAYNPKRLNEDKTAPYRSDRFYCVNDEWYFAIRRGPDQGPYPSQESAQAALKKFIAEELALERRPAWAPPGRSVAHCAVANGAAGAGLKPV